VFPGNTPAVERAKDLITKWHEKNGSEGNTFAAVLIVIVYAKIKLRDKLIQKYEQIWHVT